MSEPAGKERPSDEIPLRGPIEGEVADGQGRFIRPVDTGEDRPIFVRREAHEFPGDEIDGGMDYGV